MSAALVFLCLAAPHAASAQDDEPSDGSRVLLVFSGGDDDVRTLEGAAPHFQGPVLELADVRFAGDQERDELFADCGAALGASPEAVRECRLGAANRAYVEQVLELSASRDGRRQWDVALRVWNPVDNELVFTKVVSSEGKGLKAAAKEALPRLASGYVCFRGIQRGCSGSTVAAGGGRLEIKNVTPSPVTVFVNGVEMGPAPNEFTGLPTGKVEVTLKQAGYTDFDAVLRLSEESPVTLEDVALEPMPAMLRVTATRADAGVWVDGEHRGTAGPDMDVTLELPPGTFAIAVGGFGSTMYREDVTLAPGTQAVIDATIDDATELVNTCMDAPRKKACKVACESGDPDSCGEYGALLYSAGDNRAWAGARGAFQFACDNGVANACNNLAFMTEKGQGGARDPEAARELYDSACSGTIARACFNLGMLLQSGSGSLAADPSAARAAWTAGCDAGEGRACYQLGDVLFRGDGVSADPSEAAVYFERACDAGTLGGCTNLAYLLESGSGVSADVDRAVQLYAQACEGAEAGACYNLGFLFAAGDKVAQDLERAKELFEQACTAGFQDACKAAKQLR